MIKVDLEADSMKESGIRDRVEIVDFSIFLLERSVPPRLLQALSKIIFGPAVVDFIYFIKLEVFVVEVFYHREAIFPNFSQEKFHVVVFSDKKKAIPVFTIGRVELLPFWIRIAGSDYFFRVELGVCGEIEPVHARIIFLGRGFNHPRKIKVLILQRFFVALPHASIDSLVPSENLFFQKQK